VPTDADGTSGDNDGASAVYTQFLDRKLDNYILFKKLNITLSSTRL
jgi:hypothetical protein